uniref:Uncharacterized protein n=1 Tax=Rhizophora mucronata TaxID=61149 RepID=A0A2P2K2X4_RHIMU
MKPQQGMPKIISVSVGVLQDNKGQNVSSQASDFWHMSRHGFGRH